MTLKAKFKPSTAFNPGDKIVTFIKRKLPFFNVVLWDEMDTDNVSRGRWLQEEYLSDALERSFAVILSDAQRAAHIKEKKPMIYRGWFLEIFNPQRWTNAD